MSPKVFQVPKAFLVIVSMLLYLLISSCNTVLHSDLKRASRTCTDSIKGYALPMKRIRFTIRRDQRSLSANVTKDTYADPRWWFCLSHKNSLFSQDEVKVDPAKNTSLLAKVYTVLKDETVEIAKSTSEAAGNLAAHGAARNFKDNEGTEFVFDSKHDPFDPEDMRQLNDGLREHGYCAYIDPNGDSLVPAWSGQDCLTALVPNWNSKNGGTDEAQDADKPHELVQSRNAPGIVYKPLITHNLIILRKADPTSSDPWQLHAMQRVSMPNQAPPFLLEIDRAMFVESKTEVILDDGMVVSVKINKPSELNAFIDIPKFAVETIVSIPAKALTIATNDAKNKQRLIEVNAQLIDTLREYNQAKFDYNNYLKSKDISPSGTSSLEECIKNIQISGNAANVEEAERDCRSNSGGV